MFSPPTKGFRAFFKLFWLLLKPALILLLTFGSPEISRYPFTWNPYDWIWTISTFLISYTYFPWHPGLPLMCWYFLSNWQNVSHPEVRKPTSCLAEFDTSYSAPDSTPDIFAKELFKWPHSKAFYLWDRFKSHALTYYYQNMFTASFLTTDYFSSMCIVSQPLM